MTGIKLQSKRKTQIIGDQIAGYILLDRVYYRLCVDDALGEPGNIILSLRGICADEMDATTLLVAMAASDNLVAGWGER